MIAQTRDPRRAVRFSAADSKLSAAQLLFQPMSTIGSAIDIGIDRRLTDCCYRLWRVIAVDVGYDSSAPKLWQDPRVTVLDRCNARHSGTSQPAVCARSGDVVMRRLSRRRCCCDDGFIAAQCRTVRS